MINGRIREQNRAQSNIMGFSGCNLIIHSEHQYVGHTMKAREGMFKRRPRRTDTCGGPSIAITTRKKMFSSGSNILRNRKQHK